MSEAPERICALPIGYWINAKRSPHESLFAEKHSEYIRADIHDARVKELEDRIKDLELPADNDRSYAKGFTQGYSEGWNDGEDKTNGAGR